MQPSQTSFPSKLEFTPSMGVVPDFDSKIQDDTPLQAPLRKIKNDSEAGDNSDTEECSEACEYNDYSRVKMDNLSDMSAFIYAAASAKEPPFPVKLYRILCNPEFSNLIAWLPHGRSWRVLKPKAFEEQVIPLHFRHCRYASFMRQVNGWGFKRVFQGPDLNSYYHELFLRGLPHLTLQMRRPPSKKINAQAAMNSSKLSSPDFYNMSKNNPLPTIDNPSTLAGNIQSSSNISSNIDHPSVVRNVQNNRASDPNPFMELGTFPPENFTSERASFQAQQRNLQQKILEQLTSANSNAFTSTSLPQGPHIQNPFDAEKVLASLLAQQTANQRALEFANHQVNSQLENLSPPVQNFRQNHLSRQQQASILSMQQPSIEQHIGGLTLQMQQQHQNSLNSVPSTIVTNQNEIDQVRNLLLQKELEDRLRLVASLKTSFSA